jgi:hypothetical protein
MANTELKNDLVEALYILRGALKGRDTEDAHNILIDGSYDYDRDDEEECEKMEVIMEDELETYLTKLDKIILAVSKELVSL